MSLGGTRRLVPPYRLFTHTTFPHPSSDTSTSLPWPVSDTFYAGWDESSSPTMSLYVGWDESSSPTMSLGGTRRLVPPYRLFTHTTFPHPSSDTPTSLPWPVSDTFYAGWDESSSPTMSLYVGWDESSSPTIS